MQNPYVKRLKNDSAENRRVAIIFVAVIAVYATIATFVLTNAA